MLKKTVKRLKITQIVENIGIYS